MREKNMRAMNTFKEPTKKRGITTWEGAHTRRKIQRQIDFIIINNNKANWVKRAYTGEIASKKKHSGHRIVISEIEAKYKKNNKINKQYRDHVTYIIQELREDYENLKIEWRETDKKIVEIENKKRLTTQKKK